jgi:hypothetical protein
VSTPTLFSAGAVHAGQIAGETLDALVAGDELSRAIAPLPATQLRTSGDPGRVAPDGHP